MNKNIKDLFVVITLIISLICSIQIFIYRMQNPHLTGTELMLYGLSKYWWCVIMIIISGLIS